MLTIECVIRNKNNMTYTCQPNNIPKVNESIIFKVLDVIHYTNRADVVSLIVENK